MNAETVRVTVSTTHSTHHSTRLVDAGHCVSVTSFISTTVNTRVFVIAAVESDGCIMYRDGNGVEVVQHKASVEDYVRHNRSHDWIVICRHREPLLGC